MKFISITVLCSLRRLHLIWSSTLQAQVTHGQCYTSYVQIHMTRDDAVMTHKANPTLRMHIRLNLAHACQASPAYACQACQHDANGTQQGDRLPEGTAAAKGQHRQHQQQQSPSHISLQTHPNLISVPHNNLQQACKHASAHQLTKQLLTAVA